MDKEQEINNMVGLIVNSIENNYYDEKEEILSDLYAAGGQSQTLEDFLYNNDVEDLFLYEDLIDNLTTEDLNKIATMIISKLENVVDEGIQEPLNEIEEVTESLEVKTEDTEPDLELNIEMANGETNQELEQNTLTAEEVTNEVKSLMDEEKNLISRYNTFLANISNRVSREVYEVIEEEINSIKENSADNEELLNKIFNALAFIATEPESLDNEEVIQTDDDMEDIFNTLETEGKLHFENMENLAKKYSLAKGVEYNEEYQKYVRKTMLERYGILEDKTYTIISEEGIKNQLKAEAKQQSQIELTNKVKEEAEKNAKETGEDTYVYQIGDDIFFATEKPTHTALFNKALVLGKYKVSTNGKEVTATWFEESKDNEYKYKRTLTEGTLQDDKTIEDPNESNAVKEIEKEAGKDHEGKIPKGTEVESPVGGMIFTEEDKEYRNFVKGLLDSGAIDDPEHYRNLNDKEKEELIDTWMKDSDVKSDWKNVKESKEIEIVEEIGEDYEKITLDEYKKRNKEFIDLCYKNTWGEGEVDKDLYNELADSMYTDSVTGNINTKKDYESLNDMIEGSNIETINDQKQ